jgi:hypothetical protein
MTGADLRTDDLLIVGWPAGTADANLRPAGESFSARMLQPLHGGLGHGVLPSGQVRGGAPHLDVGLQAATLDRPIEEARVRLPGDLDLVQPIADRGLRR